MQGPLAVLDTTGAGFLDACRQRSFPSSGRILSQASGNSPRLNPASACDQSPCQRFRAGSRQSQSLPRHVCSCAHRRSSLQHAFSDTSRCAISKAPCSQHQEDLAGKHPLQAARVQQEPIWLDWWQHLKSRAIACAVAALLTAGGSCSPAEARARLTQVNRACCILNRYLFSCVLALVARIRDGAHADTLWSLTCSTPALNPPCLLCTYTQKGDGGSGLQDEQLTIDVFKRNTPSVVYIENLALRYSLDHPSFIYISIHDEHLALLQEQLSMVKEQRDTHGHSAGIKCA